MSCTLIYAGIEWLGGYWTHSLSLMGDAGHMLTDGVALGLAWCASHVKAYCAQRQLLIGFQLAGPLGALLSALLMFGVVLAIMLETYRRLHNPIAIMAQPVMLIAIGGLVINIMVAHCLAPHGQNLNIRAAQLHIWADILGSLAALLTGVIYSLWQWPYTDLIFSMIIGIVIGILSLSIILRSTRNICKIWWHNTCNSQDKPQKTSSPSEYSADHPQVS